jgi:hypothetical protein
MRLELRCSDGGGWFVSRDDQYVVGFNGPHAYEWAARRRDELMRLLACDVGGRGTATLKPSTSMRTAPAR